MIQQILGDNNSIGKSSTFTTMPTGSIPVIRVKHEENFGPEPILFPIDRLTAGPWDNIPCTPVELQIPPDHDIELIIEKKNRLCVLISSPLVYRINGSARALPMLDYSEEKNVITQAFEDARKDITVHFNFASTTILSESLTAGFRALHISGYGHLNGLLFEDGRGNMHFVNPEAIINICKGMKEKWDFVFLSCSQSHAVGEAFVAAGVPHVICINSKFLDITANTFTRALYLALAEGKTVQEAFDIGKQTVIHCPGVIRNQLNISSEDEAGKFQLLPPGDSHNVPIFLASPVANWPPRGTTCPGNFPYDFPKTHLLPRTPKNMVGREVDTYILVNEILNNRAVQLQGPEGIGKTVVAATAGRYVMERKIFRNGVIFLELAGVKTFHHFLFALVRVLRTDFPTIIEKMEKLSMSMSSTRNNLDYSTTTSLPDMEQRKVLTQFHKLSHVEFEISSENDIDSVDYQAELLLTTLDSTNFLLILDHANALTMSEGKRQEDCTIFLGFIDKLLNRCSEVRVLLTTTDGQQVNPGGFGTYNERKLYLPPLNLHSSLILFSQLTSAFKTDQQRNDFIDRFIQKHSRQNIEDQEEMIRFRVKLFTLLGRGNPSTILGTVSNNDQQTFKELCELLE